MNDALDRIERPDDLPERWDELAIDYYQKREFLRHCHTHNPCRQRYYVLSRNGDLQAGAVVYTLTLDLFTYLGVRSPTTMQVIGIPASVASGGLVGDPALYGALLEGILRREAGLFACLNLDTVPPGSPMFVGRTWPDIVLTNRFGSWDQYVAALRSEYRRRLRRVMTDAAGYEVRRMPCGGFTDAMHDLYLEVHRRSRGKLERLNAAFFRNLPAPFGLTTFSAGGAIRGWTITLRQGDRFSFFLGGQDHRASPRELYLVKLLDVVRSGVESGASAIHLGQSAEIPKMRLGGKPQEKVMLAYHSRAFPRVMLRAGMGILSYRTHVPDTNVFRGGVV